LSDRVTVEGNTVDNAGREWCDPANKKKRQPSRQTQAVKLREGFDEAS
jgi:hypothetical protein